MQTHRLNWQNIHQFGGLWLEHHRLRYENFVARQGWDIPNFDRLEWDQYDTPRAQYIIVEHNHTCAAACRLVSTEHPYMIEEVFSHLLPYDLPKTDRVWEATRFVVDADLSPDLRAMALQQLIIGVQQFGLDYQLDRFLGLMPIPIFKMALMRNGVEVDIHTDTAALIDGKRTATGDIYISQATIDRLQGRLAA